MMSERNRTANDAQGEVLPVVRRPALTLAALFLLIVFAVAAAYAGASLPLLVLGLFSDGVVALLWLLAMAGMGTALLRAMRLHFAEPALQAAAGTALGIGLTSLLVLGLGLLGVMHAAVAWVIVAAGLAGAGVELVIWHRGQLTAAPATTGFSKWHALLLVMAPMAGLALVAAFVPPGVLWGDEPHGYDVLSYHFQVPREWYESGSILPLQHNVFSFFPFNVEMHYLLAMYLRGGPWAGMYVAQLMHLAMVAMTVVAAGAIASSRGGAGAAIAATAVGAMPWMVLLAPVGYNEGGLLLFGTLAIGLAAKAQDVKGQKGRHLSLAGAMAGFACGAKLTAVPLVLLAVPLAIAATALVKPAGRTRLQWVGVALYCLCAAITFSPWLLRNMAWTGNPVFPQATSVVGSGHFTAEQVERWKLAHSPRDDQRSITERVHALGSQILWDWRYGYLFLPIAVIAGVAVRSRECVMLLAVLGVHLLVWLLMTHLQSRFFVLAIPIYALLLGQVAGRAAGAVAAAIVLMAVIGLAQLDARYGQSGGGLLPRITAAGGLGLQDLHWQLGVDLAGVPGDATLVLVGDARAFLHSRPMNQLRYRTVFDVPNGDRGAIAAWSAGAPGDSLLLVDPIELRRLSASYAHMPRSDDFLASHQRPLLLPTPSE
jgi:hypothetical protein